MSVNKNKISQLEYLERRRRLLPLVPDNSIILLPSGEQMAPDYGREDLVFINKHYHYLTGLNQPGWLVLFKNKTLIFHKVYSAEEEAWNGKKTNLNDLKALSVFDEVFDLDLIDEVIPSLIKNVKTIVYTQDRYPSSDQRVLKWIEQNTENSKELIDLTALIAEMRVIKSPAEIACIRRAVDISSDAHQSLMENCQAGMHEYALEGLFLYECTKQGARQLAYPSIVGAGENGCILHYTENNAVLRSGELVLVDAGIEYQGYASDITRTYPVNGKFTEEQKAIYELVLQAQQAAIESIRPGLVWNALQEIMVEVLTKGLLSLDILQGDLPTLIKQKAYHPFYRHSSGHWLGLDVHDAGSYKVGDLYRPLEPGMVLTVEPGLYLSPNHPNLDDRWKGIAVRIEDDVVVTETGYEVLSHRVPKTVEAIEKCMVR